MTIIWLFRHHVLCIAMCSLLVATTAYAKDARTVVFDAGFSPQSFSLDAEGVYNMEDSPTLRERGCVGFVAQSPSIILQYKGTADDKGIALTADSSSDIVLLVGTSSGAWICSKPTETTKISLELPPGSNAYSIWVGTYRKGKAAATLTTKEYEKIPENGPCASPYANHPVSISSGDWAKFSCLDEAQTEEWASCLPRTSYSTRAKDGCPGAQRCCPPADFDAEKSQKAAAEQHAGIQPSQDDDDDDNNPDVDELETDGIPDEDDDNSVYEAYTVPPIGTIASGGPDQRIVKATPFGTSNRRVHLAWAGFPDAKLPAYATTGARGTPLFHIRGDELQDAVSDSMLVIDTPRTLRATKDVQLSDKGTSLSIKKDQTIEFLGKYKSSCILLYQHKEYTTGCPSRDDFVDTQRDFWGWSPTAYQWWVAVENKDGQRGWMHIDLNRPEFRIQIDKE